MKELTEGQLTHIAIEVEWTHQGEFLKVFARAWQFADSRSKTILRPAFEELVDRFDLLPLLRTR